MPSDKEKQEKDKMSGAVPQSYEVTAQGSLGLLALGAVGIRAWKKKREEELASTKSKENNG